MDVRILKQHEILTALHLIWEVFAEDVAPAYTPEGVAHSFLCLQRQFLPHKVYAHALHAGQCGNRPFHLCCAVCAIQLLQLKYLFHAKFPFPILQHALFPDR